MYQCGYCIFKSKRKYNLKIHEERNHINLTNHATPKMSVQQNVNQASSNIQNQHNSQYGTGENTHYNEDYNNVVGIANEWKKECEIKDNAIRTRDVFLTANNSKLQDEYVKNKILIEQNQNIMEKNNQLELEKESLVEDGNNKVSAMGQDMGKLIHKYENLKIEKKNAVQTPSNSNLGGTSGCGYAKLNKTNKFKAPTTFKIGSSSRNAPTSYYELNDGSRYYRGENELIDVGIRDICQRSKGIGGMLRSR